MYYFNMLFKSDEVFSLSWKVTKHFGILWGPRHEFIFFHYPTRRVIKQQTQKNVWSSLKAKTGTVCKTEQSLVKTETQTQ